MKQYTDLKQSRTLAKILSHDSADQTWERIVIAGANLGVPEELQYRHNGDMPFQIYSGIGVPCWSLGALLNELNRNYWKVSLKCCGAEWDITYDDEERYLNVSADCAIDAVFEMIVKLKDMNLL